MLSGREHLVGYKWIFQGISFHLTGPNIWPLAGTNITVNLGPCHPHLWVRVLCRIIISGYFNLHLCPAARLASVVRLCPALDKCVSHSHILSTPRSSPHISGHNHVGREDLHHHSYGSSSGSRNVLQHNQGRPSRHKDNNVNVANQQNTWD